MTIATITAVPANPGHICPCRLPPPGHLRALRRDANVGLAEAAHRLGVDVMTLSRWERGLHQPRIRYVGPLLELMEWLRDRASQHVSQK